MNAQEPARQPRYLRQLVLPGFGEPAQRRLAQARVVVVGAGGLGSPVLTYLAAAGVGTLTIIDDDVVDVTNLHRQVIHPTRSVGTPKVDSARAALASLNPDVHVVPHRERLTARTGHLLAGHDVVVDASDNFATRRLIDDVATAQDLPVVWGALLGFDGQVGVFDTRLRYRDVFPTEPTEAPTCETAGVIGPACGMIGSAMAMEVVKLITGLGHPLTGRLLVLDGLRARWREIPLRAADRATAPTTPSPAAPAEDGGNGIRKMLELLDSPDGPSVVDLRAPQTARDHPLPRSVVLPVTTILDRSHGLDPAASYLVVCEIGRRSHLAVSMLRQDGFSEVTHVPGGTAALAEALGDEPWPWP